MNASVKNRWLTGLVLLLLLANVASIAMFWIGKKAADSPPVNKGRPDQFLIKELNLDTLQQQKLKSLVREHRSNSETIRQDIKKAKDAFFDLLQQPTITDSAKQKAAAAISLYTEKLDLLTLNHFQEVRKICRPEQQQNLMRSFTR